MLVPKLVARNFLCSGVACPGSLPALAAGFNVRPPLHLARTSLVNPSETFVPPAADLRRRLGLGLGLESGLGLGLDTRQLNRGVTLAGHVTLKIPHTTFKAAQLTTSLHFSLSLRVRVRVRALGG